MNEARPRMILRWAHITLGLVIMCYIYSPWAKEIAFQVFVKFVVIPVIALTGLWIWKFAAFNKWLGIKNR